MIFVIIHAEIFKLDRVAPLKTDPPRANSTTLLCPPSLHQTSIQRNFEDPVILCGYIDLDGTLPCGWEPYITLAGLTWRMTVH